MGTFIRLFMLEDFSNIINKLIYYFVFGFFFATTYIIWKNSGFKIIQNWVYKISKLAMLKNVIFTIGTDL